MWQRFTLYDLRVIGHYLGVLLQFSAILMAVPLVVGLAFGEWEPASRYLLGGGIALIAGTLLRFLQVAPARLGRRQALAVTGLAWIILALFASIPMWLSGHYTTYLDALFDCVSGLTTTGASIIVDLDHLSVADNMFRFTMILFGGLGLIVIALSFGVFGKSGSGASLFSSEGRSEHVVPNVVQTTQFIARITAIVVLIATSIITVLCIIMGIEPVRALLQAFWVSISGFVTGGFTPMSSSILYYHSFAIELLLMILMILGSISFVVHSEVWKGRIKVFYRDIETKTMIVWIIVATVVFTAALSVSPLFSDMLAILRRGLFMVISAFTTTGFQIITTNQLTTAFTSGAFLTIAMIMAIGGGAGSTAGGIKASRVGIIFKSITSTIKEALAPDSARIIVPYYHLGRRILTPEIVREAMTVFVLFVVTYVIGALAGIAHGYDASQAIFESIAMTSNGGLVTGIVSPGMPVSLELIYMAQMWVGRLEFVTLLALVVEIVVSFNPRRWKRQS